MLLNKSIGINIKKLNFLKKKLNIPNYINKFNEIANILLFENIFIIFLIFLNSNNNHFTKIYKYTYNSYWFSYIKYFNQKIKFWKKNIFINQFYLYILNLKKKKPYINMLLKKKNKLFLSTGIILKYLDIKEKSSKKKFSSLNSMLKILFIIIGKNILLKKKIIFEIKGLRKDIYLIIKILKTYIAFKNLTIIHTPNLIGNSLRYKKIKAIKKNLKKKLLKIN